MNRHKITSIYSISELFTETLESGGTVKLPVKGVSMYPLIRSGRDYALIEKAHFFKKYDIVLFLREDGSFVLHRIVGKDKNGFKLAGDFESQKELGVKEEQIIAKAKAVVRRNKEIDFNSFFYKMYSILWVALMPIRPFIIGLWLRFCKIRRKFLK